MITPNISDPLLCVELGATLAHLGYCEESICERLGIPSIFDFKGCFEDDSRSTGIVDSLDVLIRFLMDGDSMAETDLVRYLPPKVPQILADLGILVRQSNNPDLCYSGIFLYPVHSIYIASDRTIPPKGEVVGSLPTDVVYAAITSNTKRFLRILPDAPCDDFLDLCAGTGIGAIIAAKRCAQRAWACDVTERSARFAMFNAHLNGLKNLSACRGDLYEPVTGRTFDRIVAHPPYVPASPGKEHLFFRDGGNDGEQILKRIIEGLPTFLRPAGRYYCMTLATDREGETFEQRIRRWLGESESEFDVVLAALEIQRKPEVMIQAVQSSKGRLGRMGPAAELYETLKVTAVYYGAVLIRRKTEPRAAATLRVMQSWSAGPETLEWLLRWAGAMARHDFVDRLFESQPVMSANLKLIVTHTVISGALTPAEFHLKSDQPLVFEAACPPSVALLAGMCNGERTVRQIYADLREQDVLDPNMSVSDYASLVQLLVSNGLVSLKGFNYVES